MTLTLEPLTAFVVVIFVYLATNVVYTHLVGGYAACLAAHHRVKDRFSFLDVVPVYPAI